MGGCMSSQPSRSSIQDRYSHNSIETLFNPEDLLAESPSYLQPPSPSKVTLITYTDHIATIQDRLHDAKQIDRAQWQAQHNTTSSVILKLGKRAKSHSATSPVSSAKNIKQIKHELQQSDVIDGWVTSDKNHERISVGNDLINIQFTLPRSRAGPLVVPFLAYQHYQPA